MTAIDIVAISVAVVILVLLGLTFRYIPNNRVGIVEKRFSVRGSIKNGFIASAWFTTCSPVTLMSLPPTILTST